jgi:hypothetical protein
VNHNDKINKIENKFNLIVNNFANASHMKKIEKNTKELERYVFGPLRSHSSWREFLLMVVIIGTIVGILIVGGKKFLAPGLVKYIMKKSNTATTNTYCA